MLAKAMESSILNQTFIDFQVTSSYWSVLVQIQFSLLFISYHQSVMSYDSGYIRQDYGIIRGWSGGAKVLGKLSVPGR